MPETPNSDQFYLSGRGLYQVLCSVFLTLPIVVLATSAGCDQKRKSEESGVKPPRPVSVMKLNRTRQIRRQLITGTIAPWKTEQIGFEIAGRLSFVIEKNDDVQPELPSKLAAPPTPLARLEPERLEISLKTVISDKQVAERRLQANSVAIEQRIPAAIESAKSDLEFAKAEFQRAMSAKNAISQSELDAVKNRLSVTKSALTSAEAELAQARAEQATLESQVLRANQSIEEARRNLRNTTLYSSFRGIVSEVHAVPGSYVQPGDPVATVQMMDPMLVQFEVSPRDSRNYAKGDILDVIITNSQGERQVANGMVYTVDAVADPNSRTYTVTLHIRNQKETVKYASSDSSAFGNIARTKRVFSLDVASIITGGEKQLIERSCLHKIGEHTVIWRITNRKANRASDPNDRVMIVEPIEVKAGTEEITLLGQWKFVPVQFADPTAIDLKNDLVTGKLIFPKKGRVLSSNVSSDESDPWAPREVILEQQRWVLRAGDVVQVLKSGSSFQQGYFVPMKAILNDNQKTFVHVIETNNQNEPVAKRVEVDVRNRSTLDEKTLGIEVVPVVAGGLAEGMRVVIGGSHYLSDGARVNVVKGDSP